VKKSVSFGVNRLPPLPLSLQVVQSSSNSGEQRSNACFTRRQPALPAWCRQNRYEI